MLAGGILGTKAWVLFVVSECNVILHDRECSSDVGAIEKSALLYCQKPDAAPGELSAVMVMACSNIERASEVEENSSLLIRVQLLARRATYTTEECTLDGATSSSYQVSICAVMFVEKN